MSTPPDQSVPNGFIERLRGAQRIAIFTHQRPDSDALGSQAGLAIALRRLGKTHVQIVNFDKPPAPYAFLQKDIDGVEVVTYSPEWAAHGGSLDTVAITDTCTYQQLEPAAEFLRAHRDKIIAFDHHLSRDEMGPLLFTDTRAAAAVEIIWQLIGQLGNITMDRALAVPLMAGLVGDTGWFRFDSVTARTHLMAADLTPHVSANELYERLSQCETAPKLDLMQKALANLDWISDGRGAILSLSQKDFQDAGAVQNQTEDLVNIALMVKTVEVAVLASELPEGRIRVSLRSKHDIDVNELARQFGGGGHAKAAGCRLDGPLEAAVARLRTAVQAVL